MRIVSGVETHDNLTNAIHVQVHACDGRASIKGHRK